MASQALQTPEETRGEPGPLLRISGAQSEKMPRGQDLHHL